MIQIERANPPIRETDSNKNIVGGDFHSSSLNNTLIVNSMLIIFLYIINLIWKVPNRSLSCFNLFSFLFFTLPF